MKFPSVFLSKRDESSANRKNVNPRPIALTYGISIRNETSFDALKRVRNIERCELESCQLHIFR